MLKSKDIFYRQILNTTTSILIFLILSALAVRIVALITTDNILGLDPLSRLIDTLKMLRNNMVPPSVDRLPLHFYLMGFSLAVWNNVMMSPRLVHLLFGVLLILPFYRLVCLAFDKRIAIYSTLLLVFFYRFVMLSVVTLSEIAFLFFSLISILFLYKHKINNKPGYIIISALALATASLLRYEAWILIAVFFFYLVCSNKKITTIFVFVSIALSAPAVWMIWLYINTGNAFSFAVTNLVLKLPYEFWYPITLHDRLFYWPDRLYQDFGLMPLSLSGIGLFCTFFFKQARFIALIFLTLFLFYITGCLTHTIGCHFEYLSNAELFLIPFITSWIAYIPLSCRIKTFTISILTFICIFLFFPRLIYEIKASHFDIEDKLVAEYLKGDVKKDDNIFVVFEKGEHAGLSVLSHLLTASIGLNIAEYNSATDSHIKIRLLKNKPSYVICDKNTLSAFKKIRYHRRNFVISRPFLITAKYTVFKNYYRW